MWFHIISQCSYVAVDSSSPTTIQMIKYYISWKIFSNWLSTVPYVWFQKWSLCQPGSFISNFATLDRIVTVYCMAMIIEMSQKTSYHHGCKWLRHHMMQLTFSQRWSKYNVWVPQKTPNEQLGLRAAAGNCVTISPYLAVTLGQTH